MKFNYGYENLYYSPKKLTALPQSFSAIITFPALEDYPYKYGGNIWSCYSYLPNSYYILFDIVGTSSVKHGKPNTMYPRLIIGKMSSLGTVEDEYLVWGGDFENAPDLANYGGQTITFSFVFEENALVFYINGEEFRINDSNNPYSFTINELISFYNNIDLDTLSPFALGGDFREKDLARTDDYSWEDNFRYFKGDISKFYLHSNNTLSSPILQFTDLNNSLLDETGNGYDLNKGVPISGMRFSPFILNQSQTKLPSLPRVLEAVITVPRIEDNYLGAIFSCYDGVNTTSYPHALLLDMVRHSHIVDNVAVFKIGFRIYALDETSSFEMCFPDVLQDYIYQTIHIAIDIQNCKLYINGELTNSVPYCVGITGNTPEEANQAFIQRYEALSLDKLAPLMIGGDNRPYISSEETTPWFEIWKWNNYRYFRGAIHYAAIYSESRTAEQIAADAQYMLTYVDQPNN